MNDDPPTNPVSAAADFRQQVVQAMLRLVLYGAVIILIVLVMYQDAAVSVEGSKFGEQSSTEFLHALMLIVTASLFLVAGLKNRGIRSFAVFMAGMALIAAVREFDWLLDRVVHGFWKYPATLILIGTAFWSWKLREQFMEAAADFLKRPCWGVLLSGFLCVFVFSRLFGKGTFWQTLLEDDYVRSAKNAAEEGTELFGYTLLAIGAAEYLIARFRK